MKINLIALINLISKKAPISKLGFGISLDQLEIRIIRNLILIIFIFLILNLKSPTVASAQSIDLGIYPPVFQVDVTPPADIKVPFFLNNYTDESVDLTFSLKPFEASNDENGQISFLETVDFADPFIFQKVLVLQNGSPIKSITLSPKQQKELVLEFKMPSNQEKGDYYFSLIASSDNQIINSSNLSKATLGIAANVLLSVGPQGKTQGILENFSAPVFVTKGPVPFTVRLRNTSDHFIAPKGDIIIKNMFNQPVGKVKLLPVNILSHSIRRIPDSLQSGTVSDKDYEKIKTVVEKNNFPVAIWPEKFLVGWYKATLTLSLSDQGPVIRKEAIFFVFPFEYIVGILVVFGLVVYIVAKVRRKIY
ncbi:MAG: hypothetical protein AAB702_02390 [Patescibacteria group bacterium]